jgi:hypothetical protein
MITEKHTDPLYNDWDAFTENDNCVSVKIDDSLDIDGSKLIFRGKDREPLIEMKVSSRDIHICMSIGNPIFIELHTVSGVSVKYVKGSGKELYKQISLEGRSN